MCLILTSGSAGHATLGINLMIKITVSGVKMLTYLCLTPSAKNSKEPSVYNALLVPTLGEGSVP